MNKKLFLGMFAAAGMLLATSCSNDELDVVQSGNEAQVSFSLGLEGGIATRAISDGTGAKKLVYAVYNANGELIRTIANADVNGQIVDNSAFDDGLTENVTITLAKGQQYTVAFWAQNPNCTAYTTTDLKNVTVDYAGSNNDETRDAFFKAETFTVTGNADIDVVLKRPFAQINVGVTEADWKAAGESGIEITESKVVIKNAATSINLLTGQVEGEQTVEYGFGIIPAKFTTPETLEVDVNHNGTIDENEKYKYLSMSYILTSAERTTLESDGLQFTFKSSGNDIVFDEGLHQVPVQRNWRTNILGKLLTGDITFEVVIDPDYEDDYNLYPDNNDDNSVVSVTTADEITNAINNATSDITLYFANKITGNVNVEQKKDIDVIVNGNNYEFDGVITLKSTCGQSGASLKIQNLNFVTTSATDLDFISSNDRNSNTHNLTISNCTFTGQGTGDIVALRIRHGKDITFENCKATGLHSLMWATGTRNIKVSGVELTDCKNGVHFGTATGHVIENSTIKTISKYGYGVRVDAAAAEPQASLTVKNCTLEGDAPVLVRKSIAGTQYALNFEGNNTLITSKAYHIITTADDYEEGTGLTVPTGTVNITGANGYNVYPMANTSEMNASSDAQLSSVIAAGATTVNLTPGTYIIPDDAKGKTLTFIGTGNPEDTKIATQDDGTYEGCDYSLDGATVTFENITINTDSRTYTGYAHRNGTYKNCVINGTYTLYGDSKFENCTFNVSGDVYNIWTWGAPNATFDGCTFKSDGKAMLLYGTENTKLTIKNSVFYDKGGLDVKKAAIEIGDDYGKSYELVVNNTDVHGFAINDEGYNTNTTLWANKNSMGTGKLSVTVDGVKVY